VDLLAWVLGIKILFTLLLWALPLLMLKTSWFVRVGIPEPIPVLFLRLLGAAYLALVVGYVSGLCRLARGEEVQDIVWVGITSNGTAFLILLLFGIAGTWTDWGVWARIYMWVSVFLTASLTLGLVVSGLFRG
jgi:hypothetical protein